MDQSPNLHLPYILAAQAQKHVTHNEAIRALDAIVQLTVLDRDLASPPALPQDGDRYLVAAAAAGAWSGRDGQIAAYQDGAWAFFEPLEGWMAWIADEDVAVVWDGADWVALSSGGGGGSVNPTPLVGVNATADTTNRLAVASPASLFNHAGAGHQLKLNKAAAADTAALLFQHGFSGRAEIGLAGDDDLHVKVSADGAVWQEAIVIDRATGVVSMPLTPSVGGSGGGARNHALNGSMMVAQPGTSFTSTTTPANNDDTYTLDQWILLSDGNDIVDVTQSTEAPAGGLYSIGLDVETVDKKFGIFQPIERVNCVGLIGEQCTLSFKAKVSSTSNLDNVKAAIIAWDGTADSVTSDIVSAWGVEGSNPTLVASWTYENTPSNLGVTTSWATYAVTATIDTASAKNVGIFIWSDVTATALGEFLYVTDVQLENGASASTYVPRAFVDDLHACQRYDYWRHARSGNDPICVMHAFSGSQAYGKMIDFPVPMRATPTVTASQAGHLALLDRPGNTLLTVTAADFTSSGPESISSYNGITVAGGLSAGDASQLVFNTTSGHLRASAQL